MDISRPNFYALSHLGLGIFMLKTAKNNISSIEQLQFIEMPFLHALFLGIFYKSIREKRNIKSECPKQVSVESIILLRFM